MSNDLNFNKPNKNNNNNHPIQNKTNVMRINVYNKKQKINTNKTAAVAAATAEQKQIETPNQTITS